MAILTMALLTMALLTMALLTVVLLTCQADILPPAATTLTPLDLPSPARRALGGSAGGAGGTLGGALGGAASDWQDWCCASLLRMVGAELLVEMLSATAQALLTMAIYLLWPRSQPPRRRRIAALQPASPGGRACNPMGARLQSHAHAHVHVPERSLLLLLLCTHHGYTTYLLYQEGSLLLLYTHYGYAYCTKRGHCCCSILTMAMLTILGGVTAATLYSLWLCLLY